MKKKFAAIVIAACLFLGSAVPVFAAAKLSRPIIESATAKKSSIVISWGSVEDADGYYVYRSTSKDGKFSRVAETDEDSYQDSNVKKGKRYYYKVRAFSDGEYKDSSLSKWKSAKVKKASSANPAPVTPSGADGETVVYITETGSKYHCSTCRTLKDSRIKTTLDSALSNGYTACGICH